MEAGEMKKVKITILKTTLDKELAAEYGIAGLTACPMMKVGDVFYADYASRLYYSPPGKLRFPVMLSSSIR
jgi:uncharacterized repeat protein (TIGR04076 family)